MQDRHLYFCILVLSGDQPYLMANTKFPYVFSNGVTIVGFRPFYLHNKLLKCYHTVRMCLFFSLKCIYENYHFFPQKLAVTGGAKRYMNESERINRSGDICVQTGRKRAFQKLRPGQKSLSTKVVCDVIPGKHILHVCCFLLTATKTQHIL